MSKKKKKIWGSPLEERIFTGRRVCIGCGKKLMKNEKYCSNCGSYNY